VSTNAVDTNGAGDMFAGSSLYAISIGYDYAWAARFANAAAALVVGQFGTRIRQLSTLVSSNNSIFNLNSTDLLDF